MVTEYRYEVDLVKAPSTLLLPVNNNGSSVRSMSLFIRDKRLCLVSRGGQFGQAPCYVASWNVCDLRRFGIQNEYFCFDAANSAGHYRRIDALFHNVCFNRPYTMVLA